MSDRIFYEFHCKDNDILIFIHSNTVMEAYNKVPMYLLNQKKFHEKNIQYLGTTRLMEEPDGDVWIV